MTQQNLSNEITTAWNIFFDNKKSDASCIETEKVREFIRNLKKEIEEMKINPYDYCRSGRYYELYDRDLVVNLDRLLVFINKSAGSKLR